MLHLDQSPVLLVVLYFTLFIFRSAYHLYFGPLSKFPGPRLAALSRLYELYYDGYKSEGYSHKLRDLHKRYGPIIRISPYELHVNDPDFYVKLSQNPKLDKCDWYYNVGDALVTTPGYDEHKEQRTAVCQLFQPQALSDTESSILESVKRLCLRFRSDAGRVNLSNAYRSLTNDVITTFYLSSSNNLIDDEAYASDFHRACGGFLRLLALIRQSNIVGNVLTVMSGWYTALLKPSPKLVSMIQYQQNIGNRVRAAMEAHKHHKAPIAREGLIYKLLDSSLATKYKTASRLHTEVLGAIIAGTEGTANVLVTATFFLLCNPACCDRLQSELRNIWPENGHPDVADLLELPYLRRVVWEAYRLERGSEFRKPIKSHTPTYFQEWTIPAGTAISVTPKLVHENKDIFPDPFSFNPDRWETEDVPALKKYLGTFSKGSRSCLGQHIAQRLVFISISLIFYEFDLSFDNMNEDKGKLDGLLDLFPQRQSVGLTVRLNAVKNVVGQSAEPVKDIQL